MRSRFLGYLGLTSPHQVHRCLHTRVSQKGNEAQIHVFMNIRVTTSIHDGEGSSALTFSPHKFDFPALRCQHLISIVRDPIHLTPLSITTSIGTNFSRRLVNSFYSSKALTWCCAQKLLLLFRTFPYSPPPFFVAIMAPNAKQHIFCQSDLLDLGDSIANNKIMTLEDDEVFAKRKCW
jgi:hypothetical protein